MNLQTTIRSGLGTLGLAVLIAGCSSSASPTSNQTDGGTAGSTETTGGAAHGGAAHGGASSVGEAGASGTGASEAGASEGGAAGAAGENNEAGATSANGGSSGAANQCLMPGVDCTSTPNACCSKLCGASINDPAQHSYCAASCTGAADCQSGCCATFQNTGMMACAPRGFCNNTCVKTGASCTGDEDCCLSLDGQAAACVGTSAANSACADKCTAGADCLSGCCAPVAGAQYSVCSAPQFCQ
jgi:hypothetical protein